MAVSCKSTIAWLTCAETTLRLEMLGTWSGMSTVTGAVRPFCCTATSARYPGAASFATVTVNSHHTEPWFRSRDFMSETVTPVDGVISIDWTGLFRASATCTVPSPGINCVGYTLPIAPGTCCVYEICANPMSANHPSAPETAILKRRRLTPMD